MLRERPWLLIVALLLLFVGANTAVLVAAQMSHGPDLLVVESGQEAS